MWTGISICLLAVGAVYALCRFAGATAQRKERLKQLQAQQKEHEQMDKIMERVRRIGDDELLELLRAGADKK